MNAKFVVAMSILAIFGLTSCEKNLYDASQTEEETKITDLTISPDFDWKMSKEASFNINSQYSTVLSIYQNEACDESNLLATLPVKAGSSIKLPLSLIKDVQKVYVKYAEGVKAKEVTVNANGEIDFEVPAIPAARSAERASRSDDFENIGGTLYYPNWAGGVIMFEDNFPGMGDYDFNDFVASYIAEINTDENYEYINSIKLTMQIRAIGATKVYVPHLRLSYPQNYVSNISYKSGEAEGLDVQLLGDQKGKMVLAFNGAENKGEKEFFNTQKGDAPSLTKKFALTIEFEKEKAHIDYLSFDKFDFFLATKDHKEEIHMLGYGPAFTTNGFDYANNQYYKVPGTEFVCGISIPKIIDHAYEKANFLKAYPGFKNWITGKISNSNTWYENGNSDYLFKLGK